MLSQSSVLPVLVLFFYLPILLTKEDMYKYFTIKYSLAWLVLTSSFIIAACGQSAQPIATSPLTPTLTPMPTSTPLPEIDLDIELPKGDAQKGFTTAIRYSCHGCHVNEAHPDSGPRFATEGEMPFILERGTIRIALPDYQGRATTDREYMIESVFLPEAFIVPGEWDKSMPTYFYQVMTEQELADILAWIATLK